MKKRNALPGVIDFYLRAPLWLSLLWLPIILTAFFREWRYGLMLIFFALLYLCAAIVLYRSRKSLMLSALLEFSLRANENRAKLFEEMPTAYCIIGQNGDLLWENKALHKILQNGNKPEKNIFSIFPNMQKEMLEEKEAVVELHSSFMGRKYCIDIIRLDSLRDEGEVVHYGLSEEEELVAVYLRDETEEVELQQKLDEERVVLGLAYIDNYEDVMEQIEEVRRSLLTALVDRKITRYISSANGVIKKIEKDKYFFLLKQTALEKMMEDRFSILEEVKEVDMGNELAVTLSLGIGYGAGEFTQNYDYARTAMDMALGRGGDQAIVKNPEKLSFFGGKSQSTERVTRVKARVKAQAFEELIDSKDKVLIMGHKNADMDCLGASVGVYRMITALDKRAYIVQNKVTSTILPLKERFLNNPDYPNDMFIDGETAKALVDNNTMLVVVDCDRPSIIDEPDLLTMVKTKVVFDHHRQSSETIQGAVLSYCEPYASSASELIAEMMQYIREGIKAKPIEADCMYGGIVIDTREFTNQTGVRTFEAAAYLRRCGADIIRIRKTFREDFIDYQAKADTISKADIYREYYAISTLERTGTESPTVLCAKAANELLNIRGIKASIVLTKVEDTVFISARSIDELNVQVLMEKLGGGGHRTVAGAQMKGFTIEECIDKVRAAIDEMIEEGEVE
ncbi:DHH family phosphoesterase [Oribacterium sp. oral taxon 108]|uniref:DHH family phosphoesterase n=1 Tax=Oribacterium sp. oral taxon 108 TaxID=712414 RepID=UPI00020DDC41|nr:DHH family phosphoesterase [Oribacterium sp. oral taxon 108]EGL36940.1 DHHA1 domain protein [Oribacterium sp. oral taxon 108 str. F0425]